jgi:hypothetical protein
MTTATSVRYPECVLELIDDRLCDLGPGSPNISAQAELRRLTPERIVPKPRDRVMAELCVAGLWLFHDFLEESHEISNRIKTSTGGYWHGIMHRREPDAYNAKYWFKQVGRHPVLKRISDSFRVIYDPCAFIDRAEEFRGTGGEDEYECRQIQRREWELLFQWCYTKAVEG